MAGAGDPPGFAAGPAPSYPSGVRLRRDQRFDREREHFALRHCCEDCSYFAQETGTCRHFWPNAEHRLAFYAASGQELVFCKEFELD